MTTIEVTHSFESFKTLFAKFYHPRKYIYISLGSKYNESDVFFDTKECRTNAPLQLFPTFLQEHGLYPDKEILVVSIDHYVENHIETNRRIIQMQNDNNPQVNVILYDENITIQMIQPLFRYICDTIQDSNPDFCMISNYIRFMHPNHTENYLEQYLPDAILSALSHPFKPRFYQWFGFQPNLYNILYCYSQNQYLMGLSYFIHILSKRLGSKCLSTTNAPDIFHEIVKHPHKKMIRILWDTLVDIDGGIHANDISHDFSKLQM